MKYYEGKSVLITGGLGFIGSTLAIELVRIGANVTIIDSEMPDTGANPFNIESVRNDVEFVSGDIGDESLITKLVAGKDCIFNLAGTLSHTDSMKFPLRDLHANCEAHVALLEAYRTHAPSARVLYAGTRGQYGTPQQLPVTESHPLNAMDVNGINKTAGEAYHLLYARHYGMHCTSLRLPNTYGPRHQMKHARQGVLNWFIRRVLDGDPIVLFGEGTQVRDVQYVDDVVDAMLLSLADGKTRGEAYNLGGSPLSLRSVAELLVKLNGTGNIEVKPYPADAKGVEVGDFTADISKIETVIGWKPSTSPEKGFSETLSYYREHKDHYWS
jgi:UDP-glucose 4-epimerase